MSAEAGLLQPPGTHVAQLNVGRAADDVDSERLADFIAALASVNALAERSAGFVWRLQDEAGNATDIKTTDDPRFILNMSVWETPADLERFTWQTVHKRMFARRSAWFEAPSEATFVMWWVPAGHLPTTDEAMERLTMLREKGPSAEAFGWEQVAGLEIWRESRGD